MTLLADIQAGDFVQSIAIFPEMEEGRYCLHLDLIREDYYTHFNLYGNSSILRLDTSKILYQHVKSVVYLEEDITISFWNDTSLHIPMVSKVI